MELIGKIRAREEFTHTPILILSAPRIASELTCDLVAGVAAIIYKNIDMELHLDRALVFNMV
jgi:hypothetical protein